MNEMVYVSDLKDYDKENIKKAFEELFKDNDLLSFVYPGIKIAIKTNLVSASKKENAVVTHPYLLCELCKILINKGAKVVIGDSPGGLFNEAVLNNIYNKTEVKDVLSVGASLNHNFNQEVIETPNLTIVKHLDCSSWLLEADAIINFAKMKSHGMMSLSGATKNMFGSVPGTLKLEYHYRYSDHAKFANMLLDIQEFYKVKLHLVDAVMAMEGNGPTAGTPRFVGLLLASKNNNNLDMVLAKLMNLDFHQVCTLNEAIKRNLCPDSFEKININKDITPYIVQDFKNILHQDTITFYEDKQNNGLFMRLAGKVVKKIIMVKPSPKKKECIGCQKCANICPAKAINMKNNLPHIDRDKCIRCFCCQEFCPKGAMKTKRSLLARILSHKKKESK